jgi:3-methyladenine DNA glycosylase AlkD
MGRIVIACYRPKPGRQDALRVMLQHHVVTLRSLGMVTDRPPITMEAADGTFVEVFEWASREAIDAAHGHPVVLEDVGGVRGRVRLRPHRAGAGGRAALLGVHAGQGDDHLAMARPTPVAAAVGSALAPDDVPGAIDWLKRHGSKAGRDGMARYALPSDKAFGVAMCDVQTLARQLGRSHGLAEGLWKTGWYEARVLASYVDEPARVTPTQMDRWCRDFDNWGICDTVCFVLFDRTPHAWSKVNAWAGRKDEYVKRAAFALLWGLTVHDKTAGDERFLQGLALAEQAATDHRHLREEGREHGARAVGKRNAALNAAAVATARRLAESPDASAQWVGKDAVRELTSASVVRRLAAKRRSPGGRRSDR